MAAASLKVIASGAKQSKVKSPKIFAAHKNVRIEVVDVSAVNHCNGSALVNYDSRGVPDEKIAHITALDF